MKLVSEVALGLIISLDTIIYSLITSVFKIFMALAGARLLTSEAYYEIANKVYAVIGVVMLFVLAYSVLRGIVDPDKAMKESGGGLVKRIIIAVIGLAITPVLFNVAYQGQSLFLEHDVLSKIFFRENSEKTVNLGTSSVTVGGQSYSINSSTKLDEKIKEIGGAVTATNLWQAFFYPAEDSNKTADEIEADPTDYYIAGGGWAIGCVASIALGIASGIFSLGIGWLAAGAAAVSCFNTYTNISAGIAAGEAIGPGQKITLTQAYTLAAGGGPFGIFTAFIDNVTDGEISYKFIVSTIAGAFALYAFASFSFDMGIRAAKLAYFQIVAPIPLIMQVIPKYKDNFKNYVSSVISTFAEVFIRISVVYIVVYIICHLGDLWAGTTSILDNNSLNGPESILALALLILGLIAFARKAPEFISETLKLPKGSMSLGIKNKLAEGGGFALAATGMGAAQSAAYNFNKTKGKGLQRALSTAAGFGSGLARGAYQQFRPGEDGKFGSNFSKGFKEARESANKTANNVYDASNKRDERREDRAEARQALKDARETFRNPRATQEEKEKAFRNAVDKSPVGRVIEGVKTWSTPTVDTSKFDARAKIYGDLEGLKAKLEAKVDTDPIVQSAQRALDVLKNTPFTPPINEDEYKAKVKEVVGEVKRLEGESDASFEARQNAAKLSVDKSSFAYKPEDEEYKKAYREYDKRIREAQESLENAKSNAVLVRLAEAGAGKANGVSDALLEFFRDHQEDLEKYKDIDFNGRKLGDFLTSHFGEKTLNGEVDLTRFLTELAGTSGNIMLSDGSTIDIGSLTGDKVKELKKLLEKSDTKIVSTEGMTGGATAVSTTKKEAAESRRKMMDSEEYKNAKRNQRKKEEEKKKK